MTSVPSWLLALALTTGVACGGADPKAQPTAEHSAAPIGVSECAACGMVVREQPAPRGQLVHRDGTRKYFCSLGDLAHYLLAPSPHGDAVAVFVELHEPGDAQKASSHEAPWVAAESAVFVLGIERPLVMGRPALAFRTRADAEQVRARLGGEVLEWTAARDYLVQEEPVSGSPESTPQRRKTN